MKISSISVAFPRKRFAADTIAEWTGSDPEFIRQKLGIEERAYLGPGETVTDLASEACRALFAQNPDLELSRIGLLILVTQNPDYRLPHTSALLQDRLGLPQTCACFDVNLGCSGYVYALTIAASFMSAQNIEEAVVVTCDPYSTIMHRSDKNTVTLFGDAATATRISAQGHIRIGTADFGTDGSGAENLIVRGGGAVSPDGGLWHDEPVKHDWEDVRLHMNGRAIFNFMMTKTPESIQRCLNLNGVGMEDVDYFAFHQASRFLIESLGEHMRLPSDKVLFGLRNCGNTVSSSIPILLAEGLRKGDFAGKKILICGFGVGLSWASNLLFAK